MLLAATSLDDSKYCRDQRSRQLMRSKPFAGDFRNLVKRSCVLRNKETSPKELPRIRLTKKGIRKHIWWDRRRLRIKRKTRVKTAQGKQLTLRQVKKKVATDAIVARGHLVAGSIEALEKFPLIKKSQEERLPYGTVWVDRAILCRRRRLPCWSGGMPTWRKANLRPDYRLVVTERRC